MTNEASPLKDSYYHVIKYHPESVYEFLHRHKFLQSFLAHVSYLQTSYGNQ